MRSSIDDSIKNDFEKLYTRLRKKEGRVYTDEQVALLPDIAKDHPHHKEWLVRKKSFQKLYDYLDKKKQSLDILEMGCGNGWFSHCLADLPGSHVIGTDINFAEIQQAAIVFQDIQNLHFIYGYAESGILGDKKFDVILFPASIQYFPSLAGTIRRALKLLKPDGEIHILDSPFYSLAELAAAKQRSLLYYETIGFPEMTGWYFHHNLDDLESFNYSILYDPNSLFNHFILDKNPFYWILIKDANGRELKRELER